MTKGEWSQLSYLTLGEWWDAPQDEAREQVWFDQLQRFDRDDVYQAMQALLRDSPRFAPRLGEVIAKLEPSPPSFDEAWALVLPCLSNAIAEPDEAVRKIAEATGPVVAGWVVGYGVKRLATEPVLNPEFGGAILKRLAASYDGVAEDAQCRQVAVERTQRVLAELEQAERKALAA